jgi:hypothetical protein
MQGTAMYKSTHGKSYWGIFSVSHLFLVSQKEYINGFPLLEDLSIVNSGSCHRALNIFAVIYYEYYVKASVCYFVPSLVFRPTDNVPRNMKSQNQCIVKGKNRICSFDQSKSYPIL